MEKICTFFGILLVFGLFLAACDSEQGVQSDNGAMYRAEAILVKSLATDSASIYVYLTKDSEVYKGASIALDGSALDTISSGYYKEFGPTAIGVDSSYTLSLADGSSLDTTFTIFVPDSFSIESPDLRFFIGNPESVAWTASLTADRYILATMPPDTITYDGYEAYVATTDGVIPSEVFLDGLIDRIVGTHMIFVAAYTDAPSKSPAFYFDIPDSTKPADNIAGANIVGRTAGMVIAKPDSIIVTQ